MDGPERDSEPAAGEPAAGHEQPLAASEELAGQQPPAPEPRPAFERPARVTTPPLALPRYGRYVGLLALLIIALITVNTILTKPNGSAGIAAGHKVPPFAVPLAGSDLEGAANVATEGPHPACSVRKPGALNICALYEHHPVVLALFVEHGSCPDVLNEMQALSGSFPEVDFAAVSVAGGRSSLRKLIAARHLTFPVGNDVEGTLAPLYKLATCQQVSLILPGGRMQSKALLSTPTKAELRARVTALQAAAGRAGAAG